MNDNFAETPQGQNRTLINRTLVRIKVLQVVFAYYQNEGEGLPESGEDGTKQKAQTLCDARKQLEKSYEDTYNLYLLLLDLVYELTRYAQQRMEDAQERAKIMHTPFEANWRFANNRFAQQLFENKTLRSAIEERRLGWDAAHESLGTLYKQIADSSFYEEYMSKEDCSYDDDKAIWRKIFNNLLTDNTEMENALEELEIALDGRDWTVEADMVISYVVKTIKRFKEDNGANQLLLEMFQEDKNAWAGTGNKNKECKFGERLLDSVVKNSEEYENLIVSCLKNWDKERLSYMDMIILKVALAEITTFPDIMLQVSMNEYIDIAKEYSSENSPMFINGILEEAVATLKRENKLLKAVSAE
ncbi:MAG TPA: transcription antitermination factor NusB [Bacteroidales bacterium]|nr:transcription antitermination factor NusB [Bacteroidales bacterium]